MCLYYSFQSYKSDISLTAFFVDVRVKKNCCRWFEESFLPQNIQQSSSCFERGINSKRNGKESGLFICTAALVQVKRTDPKNQVKRLISSDLLDRSWRSAISIVLHDRRSCCCSLTIGWEKRVKRGGSVVNAANGLRTHARAHVLFEPIKKKIITITWRRVFIYRIYQAIVLECGDGRWRMWVTIMS